MRRLALFVALTLSFAGMLLSLTRGVWVGIAISLAIWALFRWKYLVFRIGAWRILLALALLAGLALAIPSVRNRIITFKNVVAEQQAARFDGWRQIWLPRLGGDRLLTGYGLGLAGSGTERYYALRQAYWGVLSGVTDNSYLLLLVSTGIVGLIIFLTLVWRSLRLSYILQYRPSSPFLKTVAICLFLTLLTYYVDFLSSDQLIDSYPANAIFWLLLAVLVNTTAHGEGNGGDYVKVAIVMEDTSRTGGIRALVEMANRLADRSHDCTIITPSNTRAIPFTTHVPIVEVGPRLPYLPNLRNLVHIATLDRFLPPAEIYIASSWRSAFPAWRAARRLGAHAAWYVQADERLLLSAGGIGRLKRVLVQRAYRLPIRWFVNSKWLRDRLGDEFDHPAEIAHPGVDLEVFQSHAEQETQHNSSPTAQLDKKTTTIVSIGRSLPIKGLPDLLAALQMVASDRMIQLVLLSPENLVLSTPFPAQIIHPISDAEVAQWYRKANLFIYASWYEGFGLPPLEAMACGVPVVTTDCGGVLEYAIDGYNSLVTPIRDPAALAQAIQRLLSDTRLAAQLIQNGLTTARRFTWDSFASQVEQIFLQFLDQPN